MYFCYQRLFSINPAQNRKICYSKVMIDERSQPPPSLKEAATSPEQSLAQEYAKRMQTLQKLGIVSILPTERKLGVRGLDGKEYPVPSLQQITELFEGNRALVERKKEQGFSRLQLVPLAQSLEQLKSRAEVVIRQHAKEGRIFQAKRDPLSSDTPVRVNQEAPVYMWDRYSSADKDGGLIYFPQSFTSNHGGMTKTEIIQSAAVCAIPGWSVALIEDSPFLPQPGKGMVKGGRKQLENNLTPNQYLQMLSSQDQYKGETGFTPHDLLVAFLTRLEETNQVSYDWDDSSGAWLTGAYFPQEGYVPAGSWNRGIGELDLSRSDPVIQRGNWGSPSTVRLPNLKP